MVPFREAKEAVAAAAHSVISSLEPWHAEHTYLNFAETRRDARTLFTETALHRLRRVKATYDPARSAPTT